jgi:hypothetical protein
MKIFVTKIFHLTGKDFGPKSLRRDHKNLGSRFLSADQADMARIAYNDELSASLDQVEPATPDFELQCLPSHLCVNIGDFAAHDAALCNSLGGEDLIEPVAINLNRAKIAHAATFAHFRLTTD